MTTRDDLPGGPPESDLWWPSVDQGIAVHGEIMSRTGDLPQHCDRTKLDGAIHRPRMHAHYDGMDDVVRLAGILAVAVAQAHAFVDGNKRTGYAIMALFLRRNGFDLTIPPGDTRIARWIERVVEGSHDANDSGEALRDDFIEVLRSVTKRRDTDSG